MYTAVHSEYARYPDIQDTDIQNTDIQDTDIQDTDIQETEIQDTGANRTYEYIQLSAYI